METMKRQFLTIAAALGVTPTLTQRSAATPTNLEWPSYHGDAQNFGYSIDASSPVTAFTTE